MESRMANGSVLEILSKDAASFIKFLESYHFQVNCHLETVDDMSGAAEMLGNLANLNAYFTTLYAYAGILKRQLKREGKTEEYQNMIDKEAILEKYLKAVDMDYRAVNRAVQIRMENNRELYYTDGYAGHGKK